MKKRTIFKRRICCFCHKKIYVDKMYVVVYPLIRRTTFVCIPCFDNAENIFSVALVKDYIINKKMSSQGDKNDF